MHRVLAALAAELAELQPGRRRLLVLGSGVIAILTIAALQRNNLSGH
jgi:threonine dehydrogenase-like Zn-dependent dehydrogenase